MESATQPHLLELLGSVIELTSIGHRWPRCGTAAGQGACGYQKLARINNPGRGNAPGYQSVGKVRLAGAG